MNGRVKWSARCGAAVLTICLSTALCGAQTNQTPASNSTSPSSSTASAAADNQAKPMEYDGKIAKRADLRKHYEKSPHAGTCSPVLLGIDHTRLNDFVNIMQKRADLRMRVLAVGLEQAYEEWTHQNAK